MYITSNHLALLNLIESHKGLTPRQALIVDQRTLGSACTKTQTRPRLVDYNGSRFVLTDTGIYLLHNEDIHRNAKDKERLSVKINSLVHRKGLKKVS